VSSHIEPVAVTGLWVRHLPAGGDPLWWPPEAPDGRWQRGEIIGALYLADTAETAWAEWYRWLAATGRRPLDALPRDLWSYRVALDRIADLSTGERLAAAGLPAPEPDAAQWPEFQALGEQLHRQRWAGVLYPSAARPAAQALCLFRPERAIRGVQPVPPAVPQQDPPVPPAGLRT
jgi:RES domain-containing protein